MAFGCVPEVEVRAVIQFSSTFIAARPKYIDISAYIYFAEEVPTYRRLMPTALSPFAYINKETGQIVNL